MSSMENVVAVRRLAAVLAADVVGYSRLMGMDEEGTLARLKGHRRELIDPKIAEHRGRLVKTTGDGVLVEFASVVDAVRCAVEMQRAMIEREADAAEDWRIRFRIGINLGDIIVDGDDIFGDGVNVAARLEGLAEPGGVCISAAVSDQIRDRLDYRFADIGDQSVKNIARPVRAFQLTALAVAETPLSPPGNEPRRAGIDLVPPRARTPRLSIVVLPFANLSSDPEQEYFVDAITDDLTTDLSRIAGSFVIARTTAFTYKGKPVDVKQIGRDLGVNFVLEGSVRRLGERFQVNVQLIDARNGTHLWAARFQSGELDPAAAQEDIEARLASMLRLEFWEIVGREIEREDPARLAPADLVMLGWALYRRPQSQANLDRAQQAFERALAGDPRSVEARIGIGCILGERLATASSPSRDADLVRAERLLSEALERDRNHADALAELGRIRRIQGRLIDARVDLERALSFDRDNSKAMIQLGIVLLFLGKPAEALPHFRNHLRVMQDRHHNLFFIYYWLGHSHLLRGEVDEAVAALRKGVSANPQSPGCLILLAAALGLKDEVREAKALLAEAQKKRSSGLFSFIGFEASWTNWNASPAYVALRKESIDVGLRAAGLPEA